MGRQARDGTWKCAVLDVRVIVLRDYSTQDDISSSEVCCVALLETVGEVRVTVPRRFLCRE